MKLSEIKTAVITPSVLGAIDPEYYSNRNSLKSEADAFERVPLVFRAVRLRCNALTRVPVYVYPIGSDEPIEEYPFEESLSLERLLWLTEAALLLKGASFTVRLRNQLGGEAGLEWLNPFTMAVKERMGELYYEQRVGNQTRVWMDDEMVFVREFSPSSDVGFGTSAASVALGSGKTLHHVNRFAANFFENGAMPVVIMGLPANTSGQERERVESFFQKTIAGIRNAFRVLAVSTEIEPKVITPPLSELALPDVSDGAVRNIAWAFDIPKTILTADSANYATAETEYRIFTEQTIAPRAKFMESALNPFLAEYDVEIRFAPEELNEMQEDEASRAAAWKTYVDGGMNPDLAAEILGVDIPKTYDGERWEKAPEPPPVPPPVVVRQAGDEMKRWEKKAVKRLKEGKSPQVEFESDVLSDELKSVTYNALGIARTEDDVKLIFRGA